MTNDIIIKAIKKINPDAEVSVSGHSLDKITWLNGTEEISKEDIEAQISIVEAEIEQEKQDKETKKASGKQKLKDLGLNDDEIKALMGA